MMEMASRFRCDECGLAMESLLVPGVGVLPFRTNLEVKAAPPGWTLLPDGQVRCPQHEPRRVVPATVMPRLN